MPAAGATRAGRKANLGRVLDLWPEISAQPLTAERRAILANHIAELVASDIDEIGIPVPATIGEPPERLTNFRVLDGYTGLLTRAAAGLPIAFESVVTRVRWDGTGAEVTAGGTAHRFEAAIVTLPLGVLARGDVEFEPVLPARKAAAIRRINAGHISKVVLVFDRVYWPDDLCFLWTAGSTQLWWRPGQGQPDEAPVLTAFFGGSAAAALEGASQEEAIDEAARQLGEILGRPLRDRVRRGRYVAWGVEPYTRMGYSSLPPGAEGLREALAEPAGRLFFAGEATNPVHPATVHGAIESGRRAASEVLAALVTTPAS